MLLRSNEDIIQIYERQVKTIYRLCFSYLKNATDTEDAVQNVFIKLIKNDQDFSSSEHEKAWLITCATNHCKDILKSVYRKRTNFDVPDVADSKEEGALSSDVYEAVLSLPDKYKDCVYLHYYEGYKTDEIAQMIGRPPSTIRSYLSEARTLLREHLGNDFHE